MLPLIEYPIIWLAISSIAIIVLIGFYKVINFNSAAHSEDEIKLLKKVNLALIIWPVIAILYAFTIGLDFPTLPPMLIVPWLLAAIVLFSSSANGILKSVPLYLLVLLGTYRVAGAIFLHAYHQHDLLSYGFAFNAGWGDVLTGVLAPLVAYLIYKNIPGAFFALIAWTFIGVGDLILAPISAAIYGTESLVAFPLSFIPLFLGPPFGILLHVVTLRAAFLQRDKNRNILAIICESTFPNHKDFIMQTNFIGVVFVVNTLMVTPALAQSDEAAKAAFINADKNSDQTLDRAEFETFIKQMANSGNANAKRAVSYGSTGLKVAFGRVDTNKNGVVSPGELNNMR